MPSEDHANLSPVEMARAIEILVESVAEQTGYPKAEITILICPCGNFFAVPQAWVPEPERRVEGLVVVSFLEFTRG